MPFSIDFGFLKFFFLDLYFLITSLCSCDLILSFFFIVIIDHSGFPLAWSMENCFLLLIVRKVSLGVSHVIGHVV